MQHRKGITNLSFRFNSIEVKELFTMSLCACVYKSQHLFRAQGVGVGSRCGSDRQWGGGGLHSATQVYLMDPRVINLNVVVYERYSSQLVNDVIRMLLKSRTYGNGRATEI